MSDKRSSRIPRRFAHVKDGCHGKLRYDTMDQAQYEIDRALDFRGETLRAYECRKCEKIHLSSQKKRFTSKGD